MNLYLLIPAVIIFFCFVFVICSHIHLKTLESDILIAEKKVQNAIFFRKNYNKLTKEQIEKNEYWITEGALEKRVAQNQRDFLLKILRKKSQLKVQI